MMHTVSHKCNRDNILVVAHLEPSARAGARTARNMPANAGREVCVFSERQCEPSQLRHRSNALSLTWASEISSTNASSYNDNAASVKRLLSRFVSTRAQGCACHVRQQHALAGKFGGPGASSHRSTLLCWRIF